MGFNSGFKGLTLMITTCIRTASLTFSNSTFCPHSVFMYFVWISEQTAIISLYSINWLIIITGTECVYCAVRTGCWNCTLLQNFANITASNPLHHSGFSIFIFLSEGWAGDIRKPNIKLMVFLYFVISATQYYLLFFTLNFYGLSYVSLSIFQS